jgi:hypothetical protein
MAGDPEKVSMLMTEVSPGLINKRKDKQVIGFAVTIP